MGYHGILWCLHSSMNSMLWVIMVHGVAIFKWGVMVLLLLSRELLFCALNAKVRSLNWLVEFQMRMWYHLSIFVIIPIFQCWISLAKIKCPGLKYSFSSVTSIACLFAPWILYHLPKWPELCILLQFYPPSVYSNISSPVHMYKVMLSFIE